MEKPIIAVPLKNIFIKGEVWDKAHELWYKNRSKELGDDSVLEWIGKDNYFEGVDIVMKRLYPDLSDEVRTKKAREMFFDSVIEYIETHQDVKIQEAIDYIKSLKERYAVGLITTNTQEALDRILNSLGLEDLFDFVETSLPEEKDDSLLVFDRFITNYGKPEFYLGTNSKILAYAREKGIQTFTSLEELKERINKL